MTLAAFQQSPWRVSHDIYKQSTLSIVPAPEYASPEVLMAALCREIGLRQVSEGAVPQRGTALDKRIKKYFDSNLRPEGATLDAEAWHAVLHSTLESPKVQNQSTKRFLQVTPIVPSLARFSGSARLTTKSWPAGSLIKRMVLLGSEDAAAARATWKLLYDALSIEADDDVFARWLDHEANAWEDGSSEAWQFNDLAEGELVRLSLNDFAAIGFPAKQFVKDLHSVLRAKTLMTRRQWTSILESILRLAAAAHVVWLCDVQARLWRMISLAVDGQGLEDESSVRSALFPNELNYIPYGDQALEGIKDRVSQYLIARLGINTVLWTMEAIGFDLSGDLSSSAGINRLCNEIRKSNELLHKRSVGDLIVDVREREARGLLCKKGIGSNVMEFMTHVLGQRQTADELLRGYDQGYVLRKSTRRSPWVASLGPVATIALVHCALSGSSGARSINRLSQHLGCYGIQLHRHDIENNELGNQLRMLGLVLDSPDAESGMLLLPPFPQ